MKKELTWILCLLFTCIVAVGCGDEDGDDADDNVSDTEEDSAAEVDSSDGTDEDSDEDSDTTVAADSATEDDIPGPPEEYGTVELPLQGWLGTDSTSLGIQGPWYTYKDAKGSTITSSLEIFDTPGKICVAGEGAQVEDKDYGAYWGAGLAIDLCNTGDEGVPPDTKFGMDSCPMAPALNEKVVGISFIVEGQIPDSFLRVAYPEAGRDTATYTEIKKVGRANSLISSARVFWSDDADPVDIDKIVSIQFGISTSEENPMPFDFCISDVQLLTAAE